ncbi:MAG: ABC transporter permease subunit [Pirellulales bacterium]
MTTVTTQSAASDSPGDAVPRKIAPRRRSRARPGVSLLATGEPMVWLTGGALTLAMTMIIGLLALVVYEGARTFWPTPVFKLQLKDGSTVMGELAREEQYQLTRQFLANADGATADAARERLGDRERIEERRRLFRIGNYELTQNHYQWVSDFEAKADGESQPTWAIVAERVEWGRFLGDWKQFIVRYPRTPSPDEQDLELLANWLEPRLEKLPADKQAAAREALTALREWVAEQQRQNTRKFLGQATSEGAWEALAADGSTVQLDAVPPDAAITELRQNWSDPESSWERYLEAQAIVRQRYSERRSLERHDIGRVNSQIEDARLAVRSAELTAGLSVLAKVEELQTLRDQAAVLEREQQAQVERWDAVRRIPSESRGRIQPLLDVSAELNETGRLELQEALQAPQARIAALEAEAAKLPDDVRAAIDRFTAVQQQAAGETAGIQAKIRSLNEEMNHYQLMLVTGQGVEVALPLANIVRAYPANRLTGPQAWGVYGSRWWEFLTDEPREANSEGGVFPAIFGTVAMTLIMSLAVVPFGVFAALYLREYAKGGIIVSAVRISINNLAGVPSIVFGVFGLGFFCYVVGATIDGGPRNAGITPWPPYAWYAGLFALALTAAAAFVLGIQASGGGGEGRSGWFGKAALALWLGATGLLVVLLFVNPYFGGFYADRLPNPTLGKGGILWSSLTLALLTLPVVIVATEEALSAVPNSMREGSYACGAGKWQTIRRIVLPQAMPGIMTGMILAMARGAGEVAPLMLVGAVKLAPELPIDFSSPFVHAERSFMHLGFHIYDLGFQSQNSEAAKPMVFTTTLLLIALVATLNVSAVWLRGRLRRRFRSGQF